TTHPNSANPNELVVVTTKLPSPWQEEPRFVRYRSKTKFSEREIRGHVVARRRGLHKTQRLHEPHRHEPEIEFAWIVARTQQVRIVVMVVLQARAEGRRDRQPIADVHRIVVVMVATRAEAPIVRPVVLDQIHPEREDAQARPDHEGELPVPEQHPDDAEADELRQYGIDGVGDHAEWHRPENVVRRVVLLTLIRKETEVHRSPEPVAVQLVRV